MIKLFDAFDEVSAKAWKQKIQVDLKGADYNSTLLWHSPEGIVVKPFYHADDYKSVTSPIRKNDISWLIGQIIYVQNAEKSNAKAIDVISRGAEAIKFIISSEDISIQVLLQHIDLDVTSIHFELQFLSETYLDAIPKSLNIHINTDIIGHLSRTGNWYYDLKKDHDLLRSMIGRSQNYNSILSVDLTLFQNAGANMIQQLAYGLAHVNEYLNHYGTLINNKITFNVAVGTNYFFEIAKIRALRVLFATLASEYDMNPECVVCTVPTRRNKTIYDYNTNMLRTTTECMSAILAEADVIFNQPYDAIYHKDNEFGERIARNQLLILKHESYFDAVNNPTDGSYYIEDLTAELADKALLLFKDIETNGGFLKQLKNGTIQRKIKESAQKEQTLFNEGTEALLGTNKHPNNKDRMKDELELFPFVKINKRKTLIEPILEKRLSENLEKERLKTE